MWPDLLAPLQYPSPESHAKNIQQKEGKSEGSTSWHLRVKYSRCIMYGF